MQVSPKSWRIFWFWSNFGEEAVRQQSLVFVPAAEACAQQPGGTCPSVFTDPPQSSFQRTWLKEKSQCGNIVNSDDPFSCWPRSENVFGVSFLVIFDIVSAKYLMLLPQHFFPRTWPILATWGMLMFLDTGCENVGNSQEFTYFSK